MLAITDGLDSRVSLDILFDDRKAKTLSVSASGRFVTEDETMIQQAKRGLAERHIKTFVAAMVRLGFRREEMIALLRQETGEENDHGSFDL